MSRPTVKAEWASGATYSTGIMSGLAPRLEPSAGEKTNGALPGKVAPPRKFNWALGNACDWIQYLDDRGSAEIVRRVTNMDSVTGVSAESCSFVYNPLQDVWMALPTTNQYITNQNKKSFASINLFANARTGSLMCANAAGVVLVAIKPSASTANRLFRLDSSDLGTPTALSGPDANTKQMAVMHDGVRFVIAQDDASWRTTDGVTLTAGTSPGGAYGQGLRGSAPIHAWATDGAGKLVVGSELDTSSALKYTTDGGATWNTCTGYSTSSGSAVTRLTYNKALGKFFAATVVAASAEGTNSTRPKLSVSLDGIAWSDVTTVMPPLGYYGNSSALADICSIDQVLIGRVRKAASSTLAPLVYSLDGTNWLPFGALTNPTLFHVGGDRLLITETGAVGWLSQ